MRGRILIDSWRCCNQKIPPLIRPTLKTKDTDCSLIRCRNSDDALKRVGYRFKSLNLIQEERPLSECRNVERTCQCQSRAVQAAKLETNVRRRGSCVLDRNACSTGSSYFRIHAKRIPNRHRWDA